MAYIDQKAAVDAVKKVIGNLDHECKPMMDFYSALWNVPAADVAPVVRCRECIHRDGTPGQPNILCFQMKDDDFCSYGDRRDN